MLEDEMRGLGSSDCRHHLVFQTCLAATWKIQYVYQLQGLGIKRKSSFIQIKIVLEG